MVDTTGDKKKYKLIHEQVDKTVDSPCIQICTYDEEEEFCIGCYRTKTRITRLVDYDSRTKARSIKKT